MNNMGGWVGRSNDCALWDVSAQTVVTTGDGEEAL